MLMGQIDPVSMQMPINIWKYETDGGSRTKFKCYIKLLWTWHFNAGTLKNRSFFSSIFPGYSDKNVREVMCTVMCVSKEKLIKIPPLRWNLVCIFHLWICGVITKIPFVGRGSTPYTHMYMYRADACIYIYVYIQSQTFVFRITKILTV